MLKLHGIRDFTMQKKKIFGMTLERTYSVGMFGAKQVTYSIFIEYTMVREKNKKTLECL